jgi:hypothetical protein
MHLIMLGVATLAIAALFFIWRSYRQVKDHHEQTLRERVAFMVWTASQRDSRARLPIVAHRPGE